MGIIRNGIVLDMQSIQGWFFTCFPAVWTMTGITSNNTDLTEFKRNTATVQALPERCVFD